MGGRRTGRESYGCVSLALILLVSLLAVTPTARSQQSGPPGLEGVGWAFFPGTTQVREVNSADSGGFIDESGMAPLSATRPSPRAFHDMAYDSGSDRIVLFGGLTESGSVLGDTWAFNVDQNTWMTMNPAAGPSARSSHAMAYDVPADRIILFGGVQNVGGAFVEVNDTWAYDFDTNTWMNRNPAIAPSPRLGHRMAHDDQSGRTVLLSGHRGQGPSATLFHDTWAYDFAANEWSDMAPSPNPAAGNHGSLAYDTQSDRIVHFGGQAFPGAYSNETWSYSFDTNTWTESQPSARPSPRFAHAMAYDTTSDRTILFGGSAGSDETWGFNLAAGEWERMTPSSQPSGRLGHRMAYDRQSDRIMLFGGGPNLLGPYNGETWAYDVDANEWIRMDIAMRPSARNGHDMAYDAESDRIVLFGGFDGTVALGDMWVYDLNTNTWENMRPAAGPPGRRLHAMAYDAQSDLVVMFGGFDEINDLGDTRVYDFNANAWTEKNPSPAPSSRRGHRMAYDAESDRIVLFGGFAGTAPLFLGDTWLYDVDSDAWTQVTPGVGPSALGDHGLAYDSGSDRVVEFGGVGSAGRLGETWTYDVNTNTWTNPNPQTRPPALSHFAMTYNSQAQRTVLFGGLAASGTQGDTWSFDLTGNAWTNMNPAVRPSDRLGHRMAYDSASDRIVLFGGITAIGGTRNNETWAYDADANTWTPKIAAPSAPQGLQATPSDTRVDLTWSAPSLEGSSPIFGYRIYRGTGGLFTFLTEIALVLSYGDTSVTEGTSYYYRVSAVNREGEGPQSSQVSATVPDVTNPSIAITTPAADAVVASRSVTVTGTASDNVAMARVDLSSDGTNWVPATGTTAWSAALTLPEGSNTIHARATDTFGNQATTSRDLVVDATSPTVTISSPTDGATLDSRTVIISGTASDNWALDTVELSRDEVTWIPTVGTTDWSGTLTLVEGENTIHVRATDQAGNVASDRISVSLRTPGLSPLLIGSSIAGVVAAAAIGFGLLFRRRRRGS